MKILLIDNVEDSLEQLTDQLKLKKIQTARVNDPIIALNLLKKHHFDVVIIADKLSKTNNVNLLKVFFTCQNCLFI